MSKIKEIFTALPVTDIAYDVADKLTNGAVTKAKNEYIMDYAKKYWFLIVFVACSSLFSLVSLFRFIFNKRSTKKR